MYSPRELREKWGFPFHLVWCFAFFQRWLCPRGAYATKNGLTHFTSKCFAQTLVLRPYSKKGVSHFTPLVFCISRAGSVHAVPMHKKKGFAHFTTDVFCSAVSLFQLRSELLHATTLFCNPELSVSHRGVFSRSL